MPASRSCRRWATCTKGHVSLLRAGRERGDRLVLSIFVNPMQFGQSEDLSRYPRDLEGDLQKAASAGCDIAFCPTPETIYPPGFQTRVEVSEVQQGLCGDHRPGHFVGVATVVLKLLNLVQPHVVLLGEKDYQQLQVIRRMVRDLALPVEVLGCPLIRDHDGLALSSRNAYLSPAERQQALVLSTRYSLPRRPTPRASAGGILCWRKRGRSWTASRPYASIIWSYATLPI